MFIKQSTSSSMALPFIALQRWLLLSFLVVIFFPTPGDPFQDFSIANNYEA